MPPLSAYYLSGRRGTAVDCEDEIAPAVAKLHVPLQCCWNGKHWQTVPLPVREGCVCVGGGEGGPIRFGQDCVLKPPPFPSPTLPSHSTLNYSRNPHTRTPPHPSPAPPIPCHTRVANGAQKTVVLRKFQPDLRISATFLPSLRGSLFLVWFRNRLSLSLGFQARVSVSRRVMDFTIRHPSHHVTNCL